MANKPVKITYFRLMIRDAGWFMLATAFGTGTAIWGAKTFCESLQRNDAVAATLEGGLTLVATVLAYYSTDKVLQADSAVSDYLKRYRKAFNGAACRK